MRKGLFLLMALTLVSGPAWAGQAAPPAAPSTQKPAAAPERKEVKVAAKTLQTYAGDYEMAPGKVLTITLENGSLWGQPGTGQKRQLFAESQTKFFLKELPVELTFQKDAKGAVTGLLYDQGGQPQREAKKVK